ncbi:MAG: hypothetical protein WDN67_00665 [Candidatus Moraniibacteriota bacterium]
MSDDLHQDQDAADKDKAPTPEKGNENDNSSDESLESLFEEKIEGDDVEKRFERIEKGLQKFFAAQGRKKKEEPKEKEKEEGKERTEGYTPKVVETLYFQNNPEAKEIWPKVQKIAKAMKRDPFEVYEDDDFTFLKAEAKALYEEKEEKEEDGKKVKPPTKKVAGIKSSDLNLSDADRALLKRRGLSEKDVQNS